MNGNKLSVVIFDDDKSRMERLAFCMPSYVSATMSVFDQTGINMVFSADADRKPNLIVINGEDRFGKGFEFFGKIKTNPDTMAIPVLIIVEDEFSELAMKFYDIADVEFLESSFDDMEFFTKITDIIENAELLNDEPPSVKSYSEEKSACKIVGKLLRPKGENGTSGGRRIILAPDGRKEFLAASLERGKHKQKELEEENKIKQIDKELKEELRQFILGQKSDKQEKAKVEIKPEKTEPKEKLVPKSVIVVVDSDVTVLSLAFSSLSREYEVITIDKGMTAIDYFLQTTCDLLIIDYDMSQLSGDNILKSIRWQENGKAVPVLFTTSKNIEEVREDCNDENVVGILRKPISATHLTMAVSKVLKKENR